MMHSPAAQNAARDQLAGLTTQEASERLRREGYNELPSAGRKNFVAIVLDVLREPMLLLLVAAAIIYFFLGDLREALVLLVSASIVISITVYQERKTERALEALRDLSSPRALVIRDGVTLRIPGRDVVRGDLLVLAEGDRVAADAIVRQCTNLSADESLLTGESVPVRKKAAGDEHDVEPMKPGGDDLPFIYSGTLVVQGTGLAEVSATGAHTEIGQIGTALKSVKQEATPLQREVASLVKILAIGAFVLCLLVVLIYGLGRGAWVTGLLGGITLAMALIPEEIPVILTVFLALGAWRIAQRHVLTRRAPAIEALGSATVLCVDKTGTLTQNRMAVRALATDGRLHTVLAEPAEFSDARARDLIRTAVLASETAPFDPMEKALIDFAGRAIGYTPVEAHGWTLERAYPLTPDLLAVTRVWRAPEQEEWEVATKGAPEAIADMCKLDAARRATLDEDVAALAEDGLRVLAVAQARVPAAARELPDDPRRFDFALAGLVGLADPVREDVPPAIRECYSAGIRVVMITGDYPVTAQAIARQIGLPAEGGVLTGPELDQMSDAELQRRVESVSLYARVVPQQKLRLVSALKARGEVVAMTGDGVNDAPALKAAHIGVAMGERGTDVAREAAAVVLLDDAFTSIVHAIRLGRRIFDNLRKALAYVVAVHVPIAGVALVPLLLNWPLVLLPVHIVFLEFVIDPACSVVFEAEPEEAGLMERPPRDPHERTLSWRSMLFSLLQGASVLAVVLVIFGLALRGADTEAEAGTLAFTTLVIANLILILSNRSLTRTIVETLRTPNAALWWVVGGATGLLTLTLTVPFLRDMFRFVPLHLNDVLLCVGAAIGSMLWFEILKLIRRRLGRAG